MNPIKLYILIPILLILPASYIQSADTSKVISADSIPKDAVPFEYDFKMKKMILIPGTLNDSRPFKYWLETGMGTMTFSDDLASKVEKQKVQNGFYKVQKKTKVRIGHWEKIYGGSVYARYLDKNNFAFRFSGAVGIIPWQFFDKKIIEISFSKQYIRELSDTKDLQNYDSVKIKVENGMLGIPVVVSVQGKKIKVFVLIDTGYNGDISFSNSIVSKYDIKSDSAHFGESHIPGGVEKGFSLRSDTIQVGEFLLTEKSYISFSQNKQRPYPFSGLIGTGILDRFDMVLDLRNYNLYLKRIDNKK